MKVGTRDRRNDLRVPRAKQTARHPHFQSTAESSHRTDYYGFPLFYKQAAISSHASGERIPHKISRFPPRHPALCLSSAIMQPQMGNAPIFTPTNHAPHRSLELWPFQIRVYSKQTNLTSENYGSASATTASHPKPLASHFRRTFRIFKNAKFLNELKPRSEIYGRQSRLVIPLEYSPCPGSPAPHPAALGRACI
jgi:hypothetical protein